MPRGPKGEKRPADVIGNAVHVMRIATGEIEDAKTESPAAALGRRGGLKGGKARAAKMLAIVSVGCLSACGEGTYVGIPKSCETSYETGIEDGRTFACNDIKKFSYDLHSRLRTERIC
jgi:hypothetical protein